MKIIKSTKNIKGKPHIKNSTGGNISIKAATNKNSSVRLQMKEELMDQILSEIKSKLKEIMTSYEFGYDDNEWEDYSGADIYLNDQRYIVITVYAEVSYHGLVEIMDALNLIVQKYDSHAYFDAETSGRCSAYINLDNVPSNMYPYDDDIQNSEKIYSNASNILAASKLTHKKFVNLLKRHFKFSEDAANIVANWYEQEDVLDNFDDIDELLNYIDDDIYDMLDASTNKEEYNVVSKYLNPDTDDGREYGEDNNGVENDPSVEDIRWAMNHLPSQFKVTGNNLSYNVAYDSQTVRVAFFLLPGAKYTYTIDGKGPYSTNQEEQINFDLQDYFDRLPVTSSTKNIAGASKSNVKATAYANSSQSQYTHRTVLKYKNKSFTIYDNSDSINLPANADLEVLRKWKAQISQQAGAYNDADEDYEWASLSNGVVSYYRRGKLVDKSYYMSPSDWGVETLEEWFQLVINDVIENLYEANRDVPDHRVYNSSDIEASSDDSMMFEGNNYEYVTNNDEYWIYRAVIDGKGVWRAMKQDSDESQFGKLSFPITYEQARGFDAIEEPSSIVKLRKDLGKMLLPNASTSVESSDYESDSGIFIEDIINSLEDNGYDLSRIRSIRRGLLELFGYKGKDADIIIHDLVASGFIDPNDWVDKDYTSGIYSATEEGYKASENYKGRRIRLLNDGTGYAIFEKGEMIDYGFKSLEDAEAAIDEYDDIYQDDVQVYSDTAEDEEDLPMVDQEYDSAATSINSNKLPAIYRMVSFNEGDVVVDFGGGKFDNAVEYIKDKGATLVVYDPYNRSAEHNREVLKILRENGGADAAVNSNVLNVIKEPEARKNVLENIARITKPGAPIYITVYEGKGNGQEGPTKSGYQLNRKTADYLEEVQEVFPDAIRKGKLIIAHNSRVSAATNTANIGAKITCSDVDSNTWVKLAQKQVLDSDGFYTDYTMYSNEDGTSYIFMFGDEDIYGPDPQYADYECSNWDEAAEWWNDYNGFGEDDILSSTILDANPEFRNNFEEAIDFFYESYPATVELTDEVDEDYDTLYKAYVKETGSLYQQKPGIVYIDINWDSGEILQALEETAESIGIEQYPDDDIEMSTFSDKNDVTSSTIKDSYEVELDPEESMIDMNIDQYIIVDSEGSWNYDSDNYDWASSDGEGSDWYSDNGVRLDDSTGVVEKIDELIEPHIPIEPGTYRVQGYIELYYTVSGVYENRYDYTEDDYSSDINSDFGSAEYNKKLSKIENIKVTKI